MAHGLWSQPFWKTDNCKAFYKFSNKLHHSLVYYKILEFLYPVEKLTEKRIKQGRHEKRGWHRKLLTKQQKPVIHFLWIRFNVSNGKYSTCQLHGLKQVNFPENCQFKVLSQSPTSLCPMSSQEVWEPDSLLINHFF